MFIIDVPTMIISAMFAEGIWAIIFSITFIVALILTSAAEVFSVGYVVFAVYLVLMAIFTPTNPFTWIWHNPSDFIGIVVGYFFIGAIYSALKYRSFIGHILPLVQKVKFNFIKLKGLTITTSQEIPEELKRDWTNMLREELDYDTYAKIKDGLSPGDNKTLIMNWIAFWPFSGIGLFIADPLKELVSWTYRRMMDVYRYTYEKIVTRFVNLKDLDI